MNTYKNPDCRTPAIGDWVRFYRCGVLVIGKVEYIEKTLKGLKLKTDNGAVDIDYVEEMKR